MNNVVGVFKHAEGPSALLPGPGNGLGVLTDGAGERRVVVTRDAERRLQARPQGGT